jgi:hypothetical protein
MGGLFFLGAVVAIIIVVVGVVSIAKIFINKAESKKDGQSN